MTIRPTVGLRDWWQTSFRQWLATVFTHIGETTKQHPSQQCIMSACLTYYSSTKWLTIRVKQEVTMTCQALNSNQHFHHKSTSLALRSIKWQSKKQKTAFHWSIPAHWQLYFHCDPLNCVWDFRGLLLGLLEGYLQLWRGRKWLPSLVVISFLSLSW